MKKDSMIYAVLPFVRMIECILCGIATFSYMDKIMDKSIPFSIAAMIYLPCYL